MALKIVEATFESRCSYCDELIYLNDEIVCIEGEWVHAAHADEEGEDIYR